MPSLDSLPRLLPRRMAAAGAWLLLLLGAPAARAQQMVPVAGPGAADFPVDAARRGEVVAGAARALRESYFDERLAETMARRIEGRLRGGAYDSISSAARLAERVTADLRAVSQDAHLRVDALPAPLPPLPPGPPTAADREARRREMARRNFGVARVERLPGNIGLLQLDLFAPVEEAAATLAAAMQVIGETDALIVDLRRNGGGDPATVAFVASYLFPDSVHLTDLVGRGAESRSFWTSPSVPGGPRFAGKAVTVVTSRFTFSAGEEFAYDLQALRRATVVGERTGGGAHPAMARAIADRFAMSVPFRRAVNAVTRTNWEGVGVQPDLAAGAEVALGVAYRRALEARAAEARVPSPLGFEVARALEAVRAGRSPLADRFELPVGMVPPGHVRVLPPGTPPAPR